MFNKNDLEFLEKILSQTEEFYTNVYPVAKCLDMVGFKNKLIDFRVTLDALVDKLKNSYWTYEYDGDLYDADFYEMRHASDRFDNDLERHSIDDGIKKDEWDGFLVNFYYDDNGEKIIIDKIPYTAEYEYYDELAEHGTWGR